MADSGTTSNGVGGGAGVGAESAGDKGSNILVTVKVRPLIKREKEAKLPKLWRVKENTIQLIDAPQANNDGFTFGESRALRNLIVVSLADDAPSIRRSHL